MFDTLRSVIRVGAIETDPVERRLRRVASVTDLRHLARRRLPAAPSWDDVDRLLERFAADVVRTMSLCGVERTAYLHPGLLALPDPNGAPTP